MSTALTPLKSDSHLRSLLKAVSWRCVGTLDTFVVSFVVLNVTGATAGVGHAARISGSIAAVEVVTKVALYYFHERAWARVKLGRGGRPPHGAKAAEPTSP